MTKPNSNLAPTPIPTPNPKMKHVSVLSHAASHDETGHV